MIELSDLKDWLDIDPDEHDEDVLLLELEARAVSIIQTNTGYTYSLEGEQVEYVWGTGTSELFLTLNPSTDPTEVLEYDSIGASGEAITGAQSDGWVLRNGRLLRKNGAVWTKGYEYKITYAGGYASGTEPGEVRQAVFSIVGILYRGRGKEGMAAESSGANYSYTKRDEAIQDVLSTLPHRGVFA